MYDTSLTEDHFTSLTWSQLFVRLLNGRILYMLGGGIVCLFVGYLTMHFQ
jgi:hypothetical protein